MAVRRVVRLVRVVEQHEFFERVEQKKPGYQRDHRAARSDAVLVREREYLGQDIERHHAEQHASGKGKDEMNAIAELEREQATRQGGEKCRERNPDRGQGSAFHGPQGCGRRRRGFYARLSARWTR
jgi:hypothetical protein